MGKIRFNLLGGFRMFGPIGEEEFPQRMPLPEILDRPLPLNIFRLLEMDQGYFAYIFDPDAKSLQDERHEYQSLTGIIRGRHAPMMPIRIRRI